VLTHRFLSAADACFLLAVWSLVRAEIAFMLAQSFDLSLHQSRRISDLIDDATQFVFCHAHACAHDLACRALPRLILDRSCCSGLVRWLIDTGLHRLVFFDEHFRMRTKVPSKEPQTPTLAQSAAPIPRSGVTGGEFLRGLKPASA
jgi:hypothetical protein